MLTPKMGASLANAQQRIDKLNATAKRAGQEMGASFDGVRKKIDELRQVANSTTNWKIFKDATKEAKRLEEQLDRLNNKALGNSGGGGIMGKIGGFGKMAGIAAAVAALSFGKASLQQASQRENQQIAFKVLTGSKFTGNGLMNNLQTMADVTPYETQDLARGAKTMLGYGVGVGRVMPMLKNIGDIAAAQDDAAGSLQSLSLAYGQVFAKGHLAGQEALQMINAGFNPLKEISVMTGRSMADLDKIMEKGGITIAMVDKAFQHATGEGGKFHNMMKEQSETLSGRWSTLMDLVHSKMRGFGEVLSPIAKGVMDLATKFLNLGKATELQQFEKETQHLRQLRTELSLSNISNERRKEIFEELKANYPSLVGNIKDEKDALIKLIPALDQYNQKRYMAAGQLAIKAKYANGLMGYNEAVEGAGSTYSKGIASTILAANNFGIDISGLSTGQAAIKVQNELRNRIRGGKATKYTEAIAGPGGTAFVEHTREGDALLELTSYIHENKKYLQQQKQFSGDYRAATKAANAYANYMNGGSATAGAGKTTGGGDGTGGDLGMLKDTTASAMQGQKQMVVNIRSFIENFHQSIMGSKESYQDLEDRMREMFLRIVRSTNGLPASN